MFVISAVSLLIVFEQKKYTLFEVNMVSSLCVCFVSWMWPNSITVRVRYCKIDALCASFLVLPQKHVEC